MLAQLSHECYTESSDLVVGLALRIEVGSSFTTTDVHCLHKGQLKSSKIVVTWASLLTSSQSILEDLLEAQEFEDAQVDSWVKTEATLVWAQGRVELNTISAVELELSLIIFPDDTELDDALGD